MTPHAVTITKATILQIIPLPGDDLWLDEYNRALGAALVEIEGKHSNGEPFHGRDVLPLGADLTLIFPSGFSDAYYVAHVLGDAERIFVQTLEEHGEHREYVRRLERRASEATP